MRLEERQETGNHILPAPNGFQAPCLVIDPGKHEVDIAAADFFIRTDFAFLFCPMLDGARDLMLRSLDAEPADRTTRAALWKVRDALDDRSLHMLSAREEIRQILDALGGTPVLTLTGPGGIGKTRLALEIARKVVPTYGDGAFFVGLAGVDDPDAVADIYALRIQELREMSEPPPDDDY